MQQERELDAIADALEQIFHLRIAGEEAEGAALAEFEKIDDFVGGGGPEAGVAHIGNRTRRVEKSLTRPIEFGRERAFLCVIEADALANVFEAAADGERGGSENDGVECLEQTLAQNLADVDRSRGEEDAFVAALVPVDEIFFVGFEEERQLLANLEAAAREARQFFGLLREGGEFGFESFERGRERVVGFAIVFEKCGAFGAREREAAVARRERVEEFARAFADALRAAQQRG